MGRPNKVGEAFFPVRYSIAERTDLSDSAKMMHQHLKCLADGNLTLTGYSAGAIGKPIGMTRKRALRAIAELVDAKMIEADIRQGATPVISFVVDGTRGLPGILDEVPRPVNGRRKHAHGWTSDMSTDGQVTCPRTDKHLSAGGHDMSTAGQVTRISRQVFTDREREGERNAPGICTTNTPEFVPSDRELFFDPRTATRDALAAADNGHPSPGPIPPDDESEVYTPSPDLIAALARHGMPRHRIGGATRQKIAGQSAELGGDGKLADWLNKAADAGVKGWKDAVAWFNARIMESHPINRKAANGEELGRVRTDTAKYANVKSKY